MRETEHPVRAWTAALFALLVSTGWLLGQRYHVRTYTELDGLPSTAVYGMACDAEGMMWFATRNGIASYDGRSWRHFTEKHGLSTRSQALVVTGDDQRVWAVSAGPIKRVSCWHHGEWRQIGAVPVKNRWVASLLPIDGDGPGRAWLGSNEGLCLIESGRSQDVASGDGEAPVVFGLVQWRGRAFAATAAGLFEATIEDGSPHLRRVAGVPTEAVKGIAVHRDADRLWLVGRDWVGTFDGATFSGKLHTFDDEAAKGEYAVVAAAGPAGGLFFGAARVFHLGPRGQITRLGPENGLVGRGVHDIVVHEGVVWISCPRGVTKIAGMRFANYDQRQGLLDDEVSAVLERADGTFVLGHSGGVTFFGDRPRTLRLTESSELRVLDLAEGADGSIWIAGEGGGLYRIDPDGKVIAHGMRPEWRRGISSVLRDREDRIWVATYAGLFRVDGDDFVAVPLPDGYERFGVRRLFLDSEGRLVASVINSGLFQLDDDGWHHCSNSTESAADNVFAFLDRPGKRALLGMTAGLFTTKNERFVRVDSPRIDRPIYFILEDDRQRVWFGTDNGVLCWDGVDLKHLTMRHGLVGSETNRAAGHLDAQGRVWIGTERGLSIYRPWLDDVVTAKPELRLLAVAAGGQSWAPTASPRLTHDQSTLSFRYRATSFVDEHELLVRTRLEGLQSEWQPMTRPVDWSVHYDYLAPGSYRLDLQAMSVDGVWSDVVQSSQIVIAPPFWRRWWFLALLLGSVAALGYGTNRFFAGRKHAQRLEREIAQRIGEMHRSEARHSVTLSSIAEGVIATGMDGRIELMNPAAERILATSLADVRGRPLGDVLPLQQSHRSVTQDMLARTLAGDEWSSSTPLEFTTPHGNKVSLETSGAPIREGTEMRGAVFAFRNITAKLRLEREAVNVQRLRSLGTLAGGIAHDFNNLLTVVLGNLGTLTHETSADARQQTTAMIETAVLRARDLTQQLLTFARGGAPIMTTVQIGDVIRESMSFVLSGANVRCDLQLADDLRPVRIDSGQISQVLNNLLINAVQAMPEGGVIRISARNLPRVASDSSTEQFLEVTIEDEGCGIPVDQLPNIFDPYFSTKTNGHGLGLATSHSIVHRHAGRMYVESHVGRGTTFRMQLPVSPDGVATAREPDPVGPLAARRVLVVDDDEAVRKTAASMLRQLGHEVECASEGRQAIDLYRSGLDAGARFDVLLMDLTIPGGMGGREAMDYLVTIDPDVCAIVASGYSNDVVMSDYERFGFRGCVHKPFRLEDLDRALASALHVPES